MELKYLRKELNLPLSVLGEVIEKSKPAKNSWIDALEGAVDRYAKKFDGRPINHQMFGCSISDNGVCVVGLGAETNGASITSSLVDMAEKVASKILRENKIIYVYDLSRVFAYVKKDLIAQFGENILFTHLFWDAKKSTNSLNTVFYTPNNHHACLVTLDGNENIDVSKTAKIIAQNALFHYGNFLEEKKRIKNLINEHTRESVLKKYRDNLNFTSFLLEQKLFFTDYGSDMYCYEHVTIGEFLKNKSSHLGEKKELKLLNVKVFGFV